MSSICNPCGCLADFTLYILSCCMGKEETGLQLASENPQDLPDSTHEDLAARIERLIEDNFRNGIRSGTISLQFVFTGGRMQKSAINSLVHNVCEHLFQKYLNLGITHFGSDLNYRVDPKPTPQQLKMLADPRARAELKQAEQKQA